MNNLLIYGWHPCVAALRNKNRVIEQVFVTDEDFLMQIPELQGRRVHLADKKNLALRLPAGAIHQGIALQVRPLETYGIDYLEKNEKKNQRVLVLDRINDPQNIGAIVRSCYAMGVDALVVLQTHAPKETGVIVKAACGAFEHVTQITIPNLAQGLEDLKKLGFWCYGLAEEGTKYLDEVDLEGKVAIVIGNEGEGLRDLTEKSCDALIKLRTNPDFSTLNASVAAGISMYTVQCAQENFKSLQPGVAA